MPKTNSLKTSAAPRIAIIGTSPGSMLRALLLAKKYPAATITLIDSNKQTGGAWYSEKSPAGYEIESGCHIWSYVPKVYEFIEREMGVKLYPVKPPPLFVGARIKIPYSVKTTITSYKLFFRFLFTFRWRQLQNLQRDPYIHFRIFGRRNRYPKSGSPELIHALENKIKLQPTISIQLNTSVQAYHITDSVATIQTEKGMQEFDQLYLTYVSQIDHLTINGLRVDVNVLEVNYVHLLIRTDKPLLKKMTYWRLINDPVIHRITDISSQTNFEENLMLVGVKDNAYRPSGEDALMDHCHTLFKKYGLIDDTFRFEKIKTHIFPTHYLGEETMKELKKHKPVVSLMRTTDLMHGIYFLLKDEESDSSELTDWTV